MTTGTSVGEGSAREDFDLGGTLTFFFEDPDWVSKLLVGSLFALLSPFLVGAIFMIGYAIALARHTMEQKTPSLPEWDDLPSLFMDGVRGLTISLAHKLPVLLLGLIMLFALLGGALLRREGGFAFEEFMFYGVPALLGGWLVVFILSLAVAVYVPAAFVRFVQTDRLASAFDFMENVEFIREHASTYVMGLLAMVLAGLIAQLGFLGLCIGIFPAIFWSTCVAGHVIGELARLEPAPSVPEGS